MSDVLPRARPAPAPAPQLAQALTAQPAAYSTDQVVAAVRDLVDGVRSLRVALDRARRGGGPTGSPAGSPAGREAAG